MWQAMALAFATVFVAELGDKSQLLALSLSARYRMPVMLAAVLLTSALTMGASVLVGTGLGEVLPTGVMSIAAGLLFLVFAIMTWLRGDDADEDDPDLRESGGFLTVVLAMSLAELGDKTMIAALALAATTSAVGVWIGATLGMASASAAAVVLGAALWQRLSPRTVRLTSAALFGLAGIVLLLEPLLT